MTSGAADIPTSRQLLVDVSVIARGDARTGIQRVVRALWLALGAACPQGYILRPVFATRDRPYRLAPADFLTSPIGNLQGDFPALEVGPGDIFLGLDLAPYLVPRYETQIAGWKRSGARIHFMIYDLLPLQVPRWFGWRARRNFRRWIGAIERQADSAICISPSVARDFARWTGRRRLFQPRPRPVPATSIRLGSDIASSAPSRGLPENYAEVLQWIAERPTILMVGTVEPRKAYDKALAAFEHLWNNGRSDVSLLIVGKPGWKTRPLQNRVQSLISGSWPLRWIDDASDEFLEMLYNACNGLFHASYAEGLGLPLLEAASHGKPLLVRDLPVFREIGLARCTYFNDDRQEPLAGALARWVGAAAPSGSGSPQSGSGALPNWQDAAGDVLRALLPDLAVVQPKCPASRGNAAPDPLPIDSVSL